ncbi:hypothetical protein DNTS_020261 [Danionella cerebrum]|uniref:Transmembrane protein 72 n=1 Tax=Danionella cerebrum TaxID=2873325 RepID=A0A553MKJ6_9TELE|nr:hypothetical protein DNTS_020261 [Danionella translucida]
MKDCVLWVMLECACRVLGISTAVVLCAVGIETQSQGVFTSLAVYLLLSSVIIMVFEAAYFIDALLATCLPCPPTWKLFILWKKVAKVGGFQKFLYYSMMSVMCFLHPVLAWHAVIPGTMLVVTGFFNFLLSKRKKSDQPKDSSDPSLSSTSATDNEDNEHMLSYFHVISSKRTSFIPSNSGVHGEADWKQYANNDHHKKRKDQKNVHFIESLRCTETEMEDYGKVEVEETTSDKAPMISL